MAITSLDGIIAGAQPPQEIFKITGTMEAAAVFHSTFYGVGRPGAGVAPSPGLAGEALTTLSGQIPFTNPGAGNSYLTRFEGSATIAGMARLCDRLWQNSGFTITQTTAHTINSVTFPARDDAGSTNGAGVMVAIEVSTATGNGSAVTNTTMSYTNQAGASGKTATIASFPATAVAGTFVPFELAAGDTGVRSIQSLTLGTSYVSGTIHLVAYRTLAQIGMPLANAGYGLDSLTGGFVRLYDNTVPFLVWLPTSTTGISFYGQMVISQG